VSSIEEKKQLCAVKLKFRPYQLSDREEVLNLFDSNIPEYFAPEERTEFIKFLNAEKEVYDVLLYQCNLVGAGGFCTHDQHEARIVWFMILSDLHAEGFGRALILRLLEFITKDTSYKCISLMTSQLTDGFYQKFGFKTTKRVADFWFKGMHLRYMEKDLN
jgi:ribosomal protein S18 acetylase RimI-like enzyme